ncbi:MAG: helix-hairpin-helix domain-containing protein [Acidobacteria bacterium]|nr:helix-hairpin-helix domain-containing protein [Acidobacteriota bacterium]
MMRCFVSGLVVLLLTAGVVPLGFSFGGPRHPSVEGPQGKEDPATLLPEGEGKQIVLSACVQCHGLGETVSHRMDAKSWETVVNDMAARGAQLLPGESEVLIQYLAQHFGPTHSGEAVQTPQSEAQTPPSPNQLVNINKASAAQLVRLLSLGQMVADAIVRYRERNGPFKDIQDITNVEGISPEILEKIRERITIDAPKQIEPKE